MRLLVVIAHPDDESFGCGSVLARAAAAGDDDGRAVRHPRRGRREPDPHRRPRRAARGRAAGGRRHPRRRPRASPRPRRLRDDRRARSRARWPRPTRSRIASRGASRHRRPASRRRRHARRQRRPPRPRRRSATPRWPRSTPPATAGRHLPLVPGALVDGALGRPHAAPAPRGRLPRRSASSARPTRTSPPSIDVAAHLPTRWAAIRAHASQASPYDDLPRRPPARVPRHRPAPAGSRHRHTDGLTHQRPARRPARRPLIHAVFGRAIEMFATASGTGGVDPSAGHTCRPRAQCDRLP